MKQFNVAVVGASGVVGKKMLELLIERGLPINNLYPFASSRSAGKQILFNGKNHTIIELTQENIEKLQIDIALFSAGGEVSRVYAPIFARTGCIVIDNSSYWRMDDEVPLIVPEVNAHALENIKKGIIANPNCSTIQAVAVLAPLHKHFKIKRVVFSTYQAVSGAGFEGVQDLTGGINGEAPKKFTHKIFSNALPQIDSFLENGYTKEEQKMIDETKKILEDYSLKVTATAVRIPVYNCHSESINVEFELPCTLNEVKKVIKNSEGVILYDDISNNIYPMPSIADNKDEVFVGRIRMDDTVNSGINMWVVADNLRKGAATNAVQIAQLLIEKSKIK